ncbi:MAG: hypothetical protein R3C53_07220 [Pirellulaceae bacterium]
MSYLAALEATVEIHLANRAREQLPVLQMISLDQDTLRNRCQTVLAQLAPNLATCVKMVDCRSEIGGGTLPGQTLASLGLAVDAPHLDRFAQRCGWEHRLFVSAGRGSPAALDLRTRSDF